MLPRHCHLTYDEATDAALLALIERVPAELWGARIALQVCHASQAGFGAGVGCCACPAHVESTTLEALKWRRHGPARARAQVLAHRVAGDASPFAPYISQLPRGVPGLPMFFSGEAVEALQYPPLVEQVCTHSLHSLGVRVRMCMHDVGVCMRVHVSVCVLAAAPLHQRLLR